MKDILKVLLRPTVLLTVICLSFAVGGPAKAAKLLGLTAPPSGDPGTETSKLIVFDTALGTSIELADTGLVRSTAPAPNGLAGPNGLAYDVATGTAYFASVPTNGDLATLYAVVISPSPGSVTSIGTLTGSKPTNATFYDGKYWYIEAATDDLHAVSFIGGLVDMDTSVADLLANAASLGFGDCSVNRATGVMLCSADRSDEPGMTVMFSADLDDAVPSYTQHVLEDDAILQLAFGGEGTLFGHNGVENSLYYVSVIASSFGVRGKVLDSLAEAGGAFTDLSSFNPLRACNCVFLVIDERSIDNGVDYLDSAGMTVKFTDADVDDGSPAHGKRTPLPFFEDPANIGTNITLFTGQVGGEAWHALKTIPASWAAAGPTADGLRNYVGNPSVASPHNVGPGLGVAGPGDVPPQDDLLDGIPDVTPLRATGLQLLEGKTVCAVLMESSVSINYGPLTGNIAGEYQGTVAFEVIEATNTQQGTLPKVEIKVLDPAVVCEQNPDLFTEAPVPVSSSNPDDDTLP